MPYTLAEAAAACGLNRTTVLRAIKSGKISGTRDINGAWQVEPAELHRVFPPCAAAQGADDAMHQRAQGPADDAHALAMRAELAEQRLADLKTALEEMRGQRDDMRAERDRWRAQAERVGGLLTDQRPPRRRWWLWG